MRDNGIKGISGQRIPLAGFEAELRAVVACEHGLLAQLCNVSGLDYQRAAKCLADPENRHCRADELLALLNAGHMLEHPALTSICERVIEHLSGESVLSPTNGEWHDEGFEVVERMVSDLRALPGAVKDMTTGEQSRVRNSVLRMRHLLERILAELDGRGR